MWVVLRVGLTLGRQQQRGGADFSNAEVDLRNSAIALRPFGVDRRTRMFNVQRERQVRGLGQLSR